MAIEIDADDVIRAESFLETLLTEQIPDGRFTEGSALRDLVIKSLAFTFANLQKEKNTIQTLQSLLTVKNIATTDPDLDRAVANSADAILSNWFITRKSGKFARVVLFIEVTRKQDYSIPANHRFVYDSNHVFFPDVIDTTQSIIIPSTDLSAVIAFDGTVTGYQFTLNVIAAKTGDDYNVAAGIWKSGTSFSPFAGRLYTSAPASGGKGRETVSEAVVRANTAIAVRNLVNQRSIDATLRERFSNINRLLVIGMGDPEMRRDLKDDTSTTSSVHLGGHYDVYLELPRVQRTFTGTIGGVYTRPDNLINVFRDASVVDWTATPVQVGDVIRVGAGLDEAPKDFVIKELLTSELRVSTNTPFSIATDEDGTFLTYFIYRPLFLADTQIYPTLGSNTTGVSSRQITTPDRVLLPGGVHYEILDVFVTDPDLADPLISTVDGYVHFPVRTNTTPVTAATKESAAYQIINSTPGTAQSLFAFEELRLPTGYDGKTLRVKYETLAGLDTIHTYTQSRFERILAGNMLVKGFYPVYLTMEIFYKLKPNATTTVNESGLRQAVVDYVNDFDPTDVLDVSDITTAVRNYSTLIGVVYPLTITYDLIVSDGRLARYSTVDEVTITEEKADEEYPNAELPSPISFGISDRTIRYMTTFARVTVEEIL